jgi:hypothetical protein
LSPFPMNQTIFNVLWLLLWDQDIPSFASCASISGYSFPCLENNWCIIISFGLYCFREIRVLLSTQYRMYISRSENFFGGWNALLKIYNQWIPCIRYNN